MIKRLKSYTIKAVAGANVATAIVMCLVGYSDHINPVDHPYVACAGLVFPIFLLLNFGFLFFWLIFKWRMAVIPVAGFLAAYAPVRTYAPVNVSTETPEGAIKVLSYNVQGYNGIVPDKTQDDTFDEIYDYLKDSQADIVCLQEDLYNKPWIQERLGKLYPHTWVTAVGSKKQNAIGIYTRYPIVRRDSIPYPSEGNGSMAFYLKAGRDTIIVINNHFESTHLSHDERQRYKEMLKGEMSRDTARSESKRLLHTLAESSRLRAPQAEAVHRYIQRHSQYPIIVCGDFNDNPISYTHHTVAQGLTDCYVETGQGIGLSYNQKGFFVRIDNILCSGQFQPYNCKVDNKIEASDHYPIICWLKKRDNPKKK